VRKILFKNIITQNALPGGATGDRGHAEPGTVFFCRDTQNCFIAMADGCLLNLSELVNGTVPCVHVPVPGERGSDGANGKDGRDGKDGADGKTGAQGPKGEPGDITVIGDAELQAAVVELKAKHAKTRAALLDAMQRNADRNRRTPGLFTMVDAVLRKLKADAEL
jgi:hypothetical protein